jgi:hypothetical protein
MTPLHVAALTGHKDIAELLLAKGADVNAKSNGGLTPLHQAAYHGHKDLAELLLSKGADVNAKANHDETPLFLAAGTGHKDVAELLLDKGADVNSKAKDGAMSLHQAAGNAHEPGSGGEVVLLAFISKRFGRVNDRTFRADQKQGGRQVTQVTHRVVGIVLRLRQKVIQIFKPVRLHSQDVVGNREDRQD